MRFRLLALCPMLGVAAMFGSTAHGQYGLYGAPDLVELPSAESPSAVSNVGYAVPTFQPLGGYAQPPAYQQAQPVYPGERRPLLQSAQPVTRRPLMAPAGSQPQYVAQPQYAAQPQYVVQQPAYAQPVRQATVQPMVAQPAPVSPPQQYVVPRYAAPTMVRPHPTIGHYYTPEAPKPAQQLQQAIPVPPTPPGMSEPCPSPSDINGEFAPVGCAPAAGGYLDYTNGWDTCAFPPQTVYGYSDTRGQGWGFGGWDDVTRPCPWYGGVSTLLLSRGSANRLWTSYEHGNFPNQMMHTDMIGLRWRAGGEVKIGRRFGSRCGSYCDPCDGFGYGLGHEQPWALQATYFTMTPFSGYHTVTHPNGVSSVLTVGNVFFHGLHATDWFDQAQRHQLWRRNEIHNVEVSFVRSDVPWFTGSRFDCDFEFGVRYFRFWEHLMFGTIAGPGRVAPALAQRAYLEDKVTNDLLGFQFGFNMGYRFHPSCRLFLTPKFGVYNNHIDHYFIARLSDGTIGTVASPPGETFPAQASTNTLAFLTQIDVGLDWQITQRLSAQIGYRAIVATGIALSDHQIPHFVNDIPEYRDIKHNGELLLHGAFAGLMFNY